jgi:putative toxin-antitoxin system antitoxin component (TIGR02293 family)
LISGDKLKSPKQLAEVYEELKELRRQGESEDSIQLRIEHLPIQGSIGSLVKGHSAGFSRFLEIKTLADRVFGDERKSEAWLQRPTAVLSGQRPLDLLKDELGAAVVREMLERIDHGIFA